MDEKQKRTLAWMPASVLPQQQKAQAEFDAALGDLVRELASVPPPITAETQPKEAVTEEEQAPAIDDKTAVDVRPVAYSGEVMGQGVPPRESPGGMSPQEISGGMQPPAAAPAEAPLPGVRRSRVTASILARGARAPSASVPVAPAPARATTSASRPAQRVSGVRTAAPSRTSRTDEKIEIPRPPRSSMFFFVVAGLVGAAAAGAFYLAWSALASKSTTPAATTAPAATPAPSAGLPAASVATSEPAVAPAPAAEPIEPPAAAAAAASAPRGDRPKKKAVPTPKSRSSTSAKTASKPVPKPRSYDDPYGDFDKPRAAPKAKPKTSTKTWDNPY